MSLSIPLTDDAGFSLQPRAKAVMRPVHIVGALTEEASGPSYSVVRLCDSLAELGDAVSLLSLDWTKSSSGPPYGKTFPLAGGPRRLGRSPAMHHWLESHAGTGEIDLIHAHGLWLMINVYPGWIAARHKIPLVISPRGTFTRYAMDSGSRAKKLFWPLIQRPALAAAACFHATADAEYEDIRRMGFRQPVAVIPNGIDLPELEPKQPRDRRTVLFLGRIHPNKGLDLLLPAWARLEGEFSQWDLVIVGSDHGYHGTSGHLDDMKRLAATLKLKRVYFKGPRYGAHKTKTFREADLYVLPTYSENFGMTVAEALSQEIPVIVTKGAPWRGLEDNGTGWWIDIGLEPLTAALREAMSVSSDRLADMGSRGRQWMQREFLWSGIARQTSVVYHWLRDRSLPKPVCVRLE